MKKNYLLGMFAATGMLLATSCSNDELAAAQSGNEAQVTFSLGLENGIGSRAISDGTKADKLVYAVYKLDANQAPVLQNVVGSNDNGQFVKDNFKSGDNVSVTLAKGQTYQVAFWAQDGDCSAYTTTDLQNVAVDYDNAANNAEVRDAFFKTVEFTVAGNKTIDVVLKRPFAQINVGVYESDWDAAVASGITIKDSKVVINNAATSINLLTGAVDGSEEVIYNLSAIPEETLEVETDENNPGKEEYKWLSMSYILVADDAAMDDDGMLGDERATLESLNYTFAPKSGNPITFAEGLNSVPVQRNWRTNILGKILTGDIQFNITIDPVYDGDIVYPGGENKMEQELEFAATFGGTVTLTEDVTLSAPLKVGADMILNIAEGKTLAGAIYVAQGATLTVNGGTIKSTKTEYSGIESKGDLTLNNVAITSARHGVRIEGGNAVINGGNYTIIPTSGMTQHALNVSGNSNVTVKDGTFVGPKGTGADSGSAVNVQSGSTVTIEGGNFSGGKNNTLAASGNLIVKGGTFDQDPTRYLASGHSVAVEGNLYVVVGADIIMYDSYADVYTAKGLLKWAYLVKDNKSFGVNLKRNIVMPALTIEEDAMNATYKFTAEKITVENGIPSGYNWIPLCTVVSVESDGYNGDINGEGHSISGLYIKNNRNYTGLVGFMYNGGSVKNLVIENSSIVGTGSVGAVVGRAQHNTYVENITVKNSQISGTGSVGGIVGFNYSRNKKANGTYIGEELAFIKNCITDKDSSINGTGNEVGGICGTNNGAAVINCINNADVTGNSLVGGVVGVNRPYNTGREGYVIACGSTADATIHATSQNAGGIVGQAFKDNKQVNTVGYIVACYSRSQVTGKNNATMAGSSANGTIIASWAEKNGVSKHANYLSGGLFNLTASNHFDSASEITIDFVNEMNEAIEDYNATADIEVTCTYKWSLTNGNWPILQ